MSAIFLGLLSALPLSAPELRSYPFELPAHVDKVLCEDANGDGRLDLVYAAGSRIGVYLQKGDGSFDCEGAGATLSLATFAQRAVAWCPTKNATGPWGIAALSGSSLRFFPFDAVKRKFSQGQVWLEKVSATLPSGVHYMSLAKDVNRDGANDLVIPSSRALAVYLQKKNGSFEAGFEARVGVSLDTSVASKGRLDDRIGQALKIPDLEMRDVNGDGRRDLISENDDLLEVFLAKTDGRLESGAAIRVETGKLKKALEPPEGEEFNPADLTSMLARGVQTKLEDYSGDGIEDLLVRTAGKVRLYRGTKGGIDLRKPSQYLKASGHVVYAFLRDENEDNSLDLCLLRVEKISLADVFLWLVVPGSLDLEVFVYRGQGGKFARRPARRLVFTLSFPSVLSLIDMGKEMEAKRGEGSDSAARSLRTGGRADSPDTFLWSGGELRFYFDHDAGLVKGDEDVEREFEEFIGYRRDKDEYVIQVVDIIDRVVAGQASAAERLEDRSPDFTIPLPGKPKAGAVRVVDWNDDGRDGLLLIHEAKDGATSVRGTIVVTSGA